MRESDDRLPFWYWPLMLVLVSTFAYMVYGIVRPNVPADPAITALKEAKYSKIHVIDDRKGICDEDIGYAVELIAAQMMPHIDRKDSFGSTCTFGDKFIATDSVGRVEMGNIYCGPLVKTKPPFKYCMIMDFASVPDEPIKSEWGPDHD